MHKLSWSATKGSPGVGPGRVLPGARGVPLDGRDEYYPAVAMVRGTDGGDKNRREVIDRCRGCFVKVKNRGNAPLCNKRGNFHTAIV